MIYQNIATVCPNSVPCGTIENVKTVLQYVNIAASSCEVNCYCNSYHCRFHFDCCSLMSIQDFMKSGGIFITSASYMKYVMLQTLPWDCHDRECLFLTCKINLSMWQATERDTRCWAGSVAQMFLILYHIIHLSFYSWVYMVPKLKINGCCCFIYLIMMFTLSNASDAMWAVHAVSCREQLVVLVVWGGSGCHCYLLLLICIYVKIQFLKWK
jgi:hypothetical protein